MSNWKSRAIIMVLFCITFLLISFLVFKNKLPFQEELIPKVDNITSNNENKNKTVSKKHRVALVIGNANYQHLDKLKNPHSDAEAIAKKLKEFEFEIIRPIDKNRDAQFDLTEKQLLDAINVLKVEAKDSQMVFIFYSGHGASLGEKLEPYILPIGVNPKDGLSVLERHSVNLNMLINPLDELTEFTVAVFDACREIPKLEQIKNSLTTRGTSLTMEKGMGRIKTKGRNHRLIAYSGTQGETVPDGDGEYSPYTKILLNHLEENSDEDIVNLFRGVSTQINKQYQRVADVLLQNPPELDTYTFIKKVDVQEVQEVLKKLGCYSGDITGIYSIETRAAIEECQKEGKF